LLDGYFGFGKNSVAEVAAQPGRRSQVNAAPQDLAELRLHAR